MGTTQSYANLRDRDYFHIMLNLDSFDGFLPTARQLAERFLAAARKLQKSPSLEPQLRPFRYTRAAFDERMDAIYQGLVDDVQRYEAQRSWTLRTRDDVVEWIYQMAPFNQTDGAWLRNIAPVGPIDEVRALLFGIWIDELGSGDPELNHANIYTELMRSVDIELPDVRSREYADDPDLLDSAFTLPLFQLAVGKFPQDYFPELLGMTLYLEWSSVELRNMVLLNRHFGLDSHFYEMHVAIDNAATGHGAKAKRAVQLHLERTRIAVGDQGMQDQWERIWDGYVAFATTGTLGEDMRARQSRPATPVTKVTEVVRELAPKARLNHGSKRLGGVLINDLFADPDALLAALVDGGLIVPGDPAASPFFTLTGPTGPMYKVFGDDELRVWRDWTAALTAVPPAPAPAAFPSSPAQRMVRLVETMRERQQSALAHERAKLTGPDPDGLDRRVTQPVSWWFGQPAAALLRALADQENAWVTAGDAMASRLVTDLLDAPNAMARALGATAAGAGLTWRDVVVEWIDAGCPQPDEADARPLSLISPAERVAAHPTGKIHGSGSVH